MKLSTKIFGSLVFAFFLIAAASFLLYSPSLLAEPKITWEPESLHNKVQLGSSSTTIANTPTLTTYSAKASVQLGDLLVEYNLPDKWKQFNGEVPGKVSLMSPASLADIEAGSGMTPPDIMIWILPNPEEITLSEFVENYDAGWYKNYAVRHSTLVDGYDALILDDNTSEIPAAPSPIAFITAAGNIVLVSGSWPVAQMFEEFLKTIEIQ